MVNLFQFRRGAFKRPELERDLHLRQALNGAELHGALRQPHHVEAVPEEDRRGAEEGGGGEREVGKEILVMLLHIAKSLFLFSGRRRQSPKSSPKIAKTTRSSGMMKRDDDDDDEEEARRNLSNFLLKSFSVAWTKKQKTSPSHRNKYVSKCRKINV